MAPTLALYSPDAPTKICADESTYGLGAVILQLTDDSLWKPIAFASRSMTDTERIYTLRKKPLALVWAYEKFPDYIIGMSFVLETDHKPLDIVLLLGKINLDSLPPRILRFCICLISFQ